MAWCQKRVGKKGVTYRISTSDGFDNAGKRIVHSITWQPPKGLTERQEAKELARVIHDFEAQIQQGFQVDNKITFSEYAPKVIALKERTGVRPRTIDRYLEMLPRINAALGHKKLVDIRPTHLDQFYANLGEKGVRLNGQKAILTADLSAWLKEHKMSKAALSRQAHVSASTISSLVAGNPVAIPTANAIAEVVGRPMEQLFSIAKNLAPLSNKTILEYHRLVSSILSQAAKEMLIPFNPASRATPPKVRKRVPDYYQPDEMDLILDALDSAPLKWRAISYLLIDTGCRRGEIAGLRWSDVDLEEGIIHIDSALLYSPRRGTYEGPTKGEDIRSLRIAPETVELLKLHKAEQERLKEALAERWVDSGFVFTRETGEPINPDSITDWQGKFSAKHGLRHIHPHAFRHTAASTMIAEGVDLVTTANELGHANATVTATIYAHQISTAKAKAGEVRSAVFRHRQAAKKISSGPINSIPQQKAPDSNESGALNIFLYRSIFHGLHLSCFLSAHTLVLGVDSICSFSVSTFFSRSISSSVKKAKRIIWYSSSYQPSKVSFSILATGSL